MAEQYVTVLGRWWDDTPILFRVVRETPQRFYVEKIGESPGWSSGGATGRGDKMYIDRHKAIHLKSPDSIKVLAAARQRAYQKRKGAEQHYRERLDAIDAEFEEAIKDL